MSARPADKGKGKATTKSSTKEAGDVGSVDLTTTGHVILPDMAQLMQEMKGLNNIGKQILNAMKEKPPTSVSRSSRPRDEVPVVQSRTSRRGPARATTPSKDEDEDKDQGAEPTTTLGDGHPMDAPAGASPQEDLSGRPIPVPFHKIAYEDLFSEGGQGRLEKKEYRNILSMTARAVFPLYSFEPVGDLNAASHSEKMLTSQPEAVSGKKSKSDTANARKRHLKFRIKTVHRLAKKCFITPHCFESLNQTLWWFGFAQGNLGGLNDDVFRFPPFVRITDSLLESLTQSSWIISNSTAVLVEAVALWQLMKSQRLSWGLGLRRLISLPGHPIRDDEVDDMRQNAYQSLCLDTIVGGDSIPTSESIDRLRVYVSSWEGEAPTVQNYRAFVCATLASRPDIYSPILAAVSDGDTDHSTFDRTHKNTVHSICSVPVFPDTPPPRLQWYAHCSLYHSRRSCIPSDRYGYLSSRWYIPSDEALASASTDFSPITIGRVFSANRYVERPFIGLDSVVADKLSTIRILVTDTSNASQVSSEKLSAASDRVYAILREVFESNSIGVGILKDMGEHTRLFERELFRPLLSLSGMPSATTEEGGLTHSITKPTSLDCQVDRITHQTAEIIETAIYSKKELEKLEKHVEENSGAARFSGFAPSDFLPEPRLFYDIFYDTIESGIAVESTPHFVMKRNRFIGEALHQWVRDIVSIRYWIRTMNFLRRSPSLFAVGEDEVVAVVPTLRTAYERGITYDNITWQEEQCRIGHEIYCRPSLLLEYDRAMLAEANACDSSVRISPAPNEPGARRMEACSVRREYTTSCLTREEVRIEFMNLLSGIFSQYVQTEPARVEDPQFYSSRDASVKDSYRIWKKYSPLFSPVTVASWTRDWSALEDVDIISNDNIFMLHVLPVLYDRNIVPRITRTAYEDAHRLTGRWDGDFFSDQFTDDQYTWTHSIDPEGKNDALEKVVTLDNLSDIIDDRVLYAESLQYSRSYRLCAEPVLDAIQRSVSGAIPEPVGGNGITRNVLLAVCLCGLTDSAWNEANAIRFWIDTLNEATVRGRLSFEHKSRLNPSFGSLIRLFSTLFHIQGDEDADLRSTLIRRSLDLYPIETTEAKSLATYRKWSTEMMGMLNGVANAGFSILSRVYPLYVSLLLTSPVHGKLFTEQTGFYDLHVRTQVDDIMRTVFESTDFSRFPRSNDAELTGVMNIRSSLLQAKKQQMSAFLGITIFNGVPRSHLAMLIKRGRKSAMLRYAPNHEVYKGFYDMAEWHGYGGFLTRLREETRDLFKKSRIKERGTNRVVYGSQIRDSEYETDIAIPSSAGYLPVIREAGKWTVQFAPLSEQLYFPCGTREYESKFRVRWNIALRSARLGVFLDHLVTETEHTVNQSQLSIDLLLPAIVFERRTRGKEIRNEDVDVYGVCTLSVIPSFVILDPTDYSATQPAELRMVGMEYAVIDWVPSYRVQHFLAYFYFSATSRDGADLNIGQRHFYHPRVNLNLNLIPGWNAPPLNHPIIFTMNIQQKVKKPAKVVDPDHFVDLDHFRA